MYSLEPQGSFKAMGPMENTGWGQIETRGGKMVTWGALTFKDGAKEQETVKWIGKEWVERWEGAQERVGGGVRGGKVSRIKEGLLC